jgi:hypothetical protein
MKTKQIINLFAFASLLLFFGCKKDLYVENTGVCPEVKSTIPANQAILVPLDQVLSVTFNTKMNPATINQESFSYTASPKLTGLMTYDPETYTMSFTPDTLLKKNTTYTGKVFISVRDIYGNAMLEEYKWTFSTDDFISPVVFCTDPENGAVDVPKNIVVKACFNIPMDASSFDNNTFTLKQGNNTVNGSVVYVNDFAYFTPSNELLANETYTATLTTGLKNAGGYPLLNDYVWEFTTSNKLAPFVTITSPDDNESNVSLSKIITATFNVAMDPLTINANTFVLLDGADTIQGNISYSGLTASFQPSTNLISGKIYNVIITNGAMDLDGLELLNTHTWSFNTSQAAGSMAVDLKTVAQYGIFSALGIANQAGISQINNFNVGISPGFYLSITGFPPAVINNGVMYAMDDVDPNVAVMLLQAKADLQIAYDSARLAVMPAPATVSGDLGGQTLVPGIYKSTSTLMVQNGNLTLDAQGDVNATWIFQISSSLTTVGGAGGSIILQGGANPDNIFWQVGSSAIIGNYTQFKGNILAFTSISMNPYSVIEGRVLCLNGSVTMASTNFINKP